MISTVPDMPVSPSDRELLVPLMRSGSVVAPSDAATAREFHRSAMGELPTYALQLSRGYPAIPTVFTPEFTPDEDPVG
jgi:nicotinate phosphoribosyltransferase